MGAVEGPSVSFTADLPMEEQRTAVEEVTNRTSKEHNGARDTPHNGGELVNNGREHKVQEPYKKCKLHR